MNIDELKNVWENQNNKINDNIALNKALLNNINSRKSESKMHNAALWAMAEAVAFFTIVIVLGGYINSHLTFTAPTLSATILIVFAIVGLAGSIGQITLIKQVDYSGSIQQVQKQIYAIREHRLKVGKLLFLSVPFYMAYVFLGLDAVFGINFYDHLSQEMVIFYAVSSSMMAVFSVWLYRSLNFNNMTVRWVRWLTEELGGRQLVLAADILGDMKEQ